MVSFIVLHYKSIDETLECLKDLRKTFKNDISIIVVDNHSLTKEDEDKIKEYTEDIILLQDNIGFAKANNLGCKYAIQKYNPEFLCVINNDVFITQPEFIDIIKENYKEYEFDMLGPWIDSRTGESCNPFPLIKDLNAYIERTEKLISIYKSSIKTFFFELGMNIKHSIKAPVVPTNSENHEACVGLHGCAIVFSKKYYEKYEDVFFNETYLFHEEEFLYNRVVKDNLISIYDPRLKVYHKEGSSISKKGNNRLSKLFKEEEKLKSLKLLKNEK